MRRSRARVLLAAIAVGGIGVSAASGDRPARPSAAVFPAPAAPVLSPRRVPEMVRDLTGSAALARSLASVMDDPALGGARRASCLTVRRGSRDVLRLRPDAPLIPASNVKLLTAIAALQVLGPETRFATTVAARERPRDGVVDGPLFLIGGGDPLLATADYVATLRNQPQVFTPLEELADRVAAGGVRSVNGGVVADESRYDSDRSVDSWRSSYLTEGHVGPVSAIAVNDGFAAYAPRRVGAPRPARNAAEVFAGLLRARGVAIGGAAGEGIAGPDAVELAAIESPTVAEQVAHMLRESDNNSAEMLVKELGVRTERGGTWEGGLAAVRAALLEVGVEADEVQMVDGSGLDRGDRASCDAILDALSDAGPDSAIAAGLAVAGRTGTLAPPRFERSPAAGRLRAKTGSLAGVAALSGFVGDVPGGGPPLVFALLANELPSEAAGRALWERVGAELAAYPVAPPVDQLDPGRDEPAR